MPRHPVDVEVFDLTPSVAPPDGGGSRGDLVEPGQGRTRPSWLPSRPSWGWLAAAMAIALLVGLVLGHMSRQHGALPAGAAAASPGPAARTVFSDDGVEDTGGLCGLQIGLRQLQVGVQIVNNSSTSVTITRVLPVLPLGGLRTGQTGVATSCGQLAPISAITEVVLDPGQRTWLIGDFDVIRDGCPSPLAVQMQVSYSQAGAKHVVRLTGFKDLSQVRFEGC